jgi:tRNA A-37 threonylcarbamoyl transferase component Bud32
MTADSPEPQEFPTPRDRAFGDIVVEMGLAEREAVNAALSAQLKCAFAGSEIPALPRLLVSRKVISRSQAERALAQLAQRAQAGDLRLMPDEAYSVLLDAPALAGNAPEAASAGPVILQPPRPPPASAGSALPRAPRIAYPTETGTVEIIMPVGGGDHDTTLRPEQSQGAVPPPPPMAASTPGEPIKGYKILGRISQDDTGAVFKARQLAMDRLVALKILPPKMTADRTFVERFLTEARNAGQLNHPSLTRVHEIGRTDKYYFYSMELVEGKNLEDNIKLGGRMEVLRALHVTLDLCRAIEHMAAKGLVHGEISPQAVVITSEGTVKLTMAGLGSGARSGTRFLLGDRYHYVAPERVLTTKFDSRADLYSAGAVLYYALTGQHPYTGSNANAVLNQSLSQPPPDPRAVVSELPADVAKVVTMAMAKAVSARFRNAAEMVAAIETAMVAAKPRTLGGIRPPTRFKTSAVRRLPPRRRRR